MTVGLGAIGPGPGGHAAEPARGGVDVKVGQLASGPLITTTPEATLREAARTMAERGVGSVVVQDPDGALLGILTERDLLHAIADDSVLDEVTVGAAMTADVITAGADWEVYEAAAEMTDQHIRHLVVKEAGEVSGVLSIRDLLLAGQRVQLPGDEWAVLRDPLTFSIRERRKLQRELLQLEPGPAADTDVDGLVALAVGSWSYPVPLPADDDALAELDDTARAQLRDAVRDELPTLQRAVHPAPGWRHWRD